MAQQQMVIKKSRATTISQFMEKNGTMLERTLTNTGLRVDRLARTVMLALQNNPKLCDCTERSLCNCIIQSATLGLEMNSALGHATMVPFWDKKRGVYVATFMLMYKGLIALAARSGRCNGVWGSVVYEQDEFSYTLGLRKDLVHRPSITETHDVSPQMLRAMGAYAVYELTNGFRDFEYMPRNEIEKARRFSQSSCSGDSPWQKWPDRMWLKTALRRLLGRVPVSVELARASELDYRAEANLPQEPAIDIKGFTLPDEESPLEKPSADKSPALNDKTGRPSLPATLKQAKVSAKTFATYCQKLGWDPSKNDDQMTAILEMADEGILAETIRTTLEQT